MIIDVENPLVAEFNSIGRQNKDTDLRLNISQQSHPLATACQTQRLLKVILFIVNFCFIFLTFICFSLRLCVVISDVV